MNTVDEEEQRERRNTKLKSVVFNYKWDEETPESVQILRKGKHYCTVGELVKTEVQKLPVTVDLRGLMPPIYDQGSLGSCTAQAVAACMHYDQRFTTRTDLVEPSRLFVYWNARLPIGTTQLDSGASLADAIVSTVTYGACREDMWPHQIENFRNRPSKECYEDAYGCIDTDGCQQAEVSQNVTEIKSVLASGICMVFGIDVYSSFMSSQVATTGYVPMPNVSREDYYGGHAMVLCGYNDYTQMFLFRNSWGADWGIGGYGWIPYAYVVSGYLAGDIWSVSGIGSKTLPPQGVVIPDPINFTNPNSALSTNSAVVVALVGGLAALVVLGLLVAWMAAPRSSSVPVKTVQMKKRR